ncbi:hypothetical protein NBRC111894_1166 [Sporolactobacillus inulinus]|uniref:Uncharacterized protein n=1 Tax=Sporolactobacillus inulinus TaxID=2078 RepID=A0A4Y1Z984_9BACL|nr:hypothetical protein NBRC111894_1166 [Sporolactobacillus inulinus]
MNGFCRKFCKKVKTLSINKNAKISDAEFRKIVDEVVQMKCIN